MLLADVLMWSLLVVAVLLALPGLWLLGCSLYPRQVEDVAVYLERGRLKPFLIGVPIAAATFLMVVAFGGKKNPFCDIAAISTLAFFLFYAHLGVAGLVTMIGRKLPSPADRDRPWRCTIRGGIVLELAYLVPLLGWFFILPVSMVIGAGAMTSRLIARRKDKHKTSGVRPCDTEKHESADEVVGASG